MQPETDRRREAACDNGPSYEPYSFPWGYQGASYHPHVTRRASSYHKNWPRLRPERSRTTRNMRRSSARHSAHDVSQESPACALRKNLDLAPSHRIQNRKRSSWPGASVRPKGRRFLADVVMLSAGAELLRMFLVVRERSVASRQFLWI